MAIPEIQEFRIDASMSVKKYFKQNRNLWITTFLLVILIKIFSQNQTWVERYYSSNVYIFLSKILRILFGWIPFSLGDLLYFFACCWIVWKTIKNARLVFKRKLHKEIIIKKTLKFILALALLYIVFYILWGINYDRKGIAFQLQIQPQSYDTTDLFLIQNILLQKVNSSKMVVIKNEEKYPSTDQLIRRAKNSYAQVKKKFPFLNYDYLSVKSTLYGTLGDYLGFTGYYNPFTGEAQINTTVPQMLRPYIATHEMAHQLGYAKENEANFVGYLAAVNSQDTLFHYSAYLDLFLYANREIYYFDSLASQNIMGKLNPYVKQDLIELRKFNRAHQSFLEPVISWMYGNYLKLNNQPKGLHSYNAVVGMLIAYYKKYGKI
jgi:hypothetical protein